MNDETAAGQPGGEALLASRQAQLGAQAAVAAYDAHVQPAINAIDRWYAAHFHAAALAGRAPITAEDKASLIQHVTEAITPKE